jgi:hypothetical protein
VREIRPRRIHLLGIGYETRRARRLVELLLSADPEKAATGFDGSNAFLRSSSALCRVNAKEAGLFIVFATVESLRRLQGHHRVPGGKALAGIFCREEGRQARHPRFFHLRTDL